MLPPPYRRLASKDLESELPSSGEALEEDILFVQNSEERNVSTE
jgi:hypothetical protein